MFLKSFYKGKRVLVTGHTGFKGGWLATWLKMLGAKVIGYSLPPETENGGFFEAARIATDIDSIYSDITDFKTLYEVFKKYKPEIVFHLAAQPLVRRSYRNPLETFSTNVMGTVNTLEAIRNTPSVRVVVNITSDKCYSNKEWVWGYRETDLLGGHDPYSSSKSCSELVSAAYRSSFFCGENQVSLASARAGNVIGGGDWAEDRLVPDIVRAILSGTPVIIRHPCAIRPWQHVLEPLRGYLMLGERLGTQGSGFAEAWNFGPSEKDVISVKELAQMVISLWGKGELSILEDKEGFYETSYLKLDCSKARARLGWVPLLSIDEALKMTVEWYQSFFENNGSVVRSTEMQIMGYMERIYQ